MLYDNEPCVQMGLKGAQPPYHLSTYSQKRNNLSIHCREPVLLKMSAYRADVIYSGHLYPLIISNREEETSICQNSFEILHLDPHNIDSPKLSFLFLSYPGSLSAVCKHLPTPSIMIIIKKDYWPVTERQQLALGPAWPRRAGTGWESSFAPSSPSPAGPAPPSPPDPPAAGHGKSAPGGRDGI